LHIHIFQRPTLFVVEDLYVVGMKFYGPAQLQVEKTYTLVRDASNIYDGNAISVKDKDGVTRGYLTRSSARLLAPIMDRDIVNSKLLLKAKRCAELRNHKMEQYCHVAFTVKEERLSLAGSLLSSAVFRVMNI
jgi:hypothetical protein